MKQPEIFTNNTIDWATCGIFKTYSVQQNKNKNRNKAKAAQAENASPFPLV